MAVVKNPRFARENPRGAFFIEHDSPVPVAAGVDDVPVKFVVWFVVGLAITSVGLTVALVAGFTVGLTVALVGLTVGLIVGLIVGLTVGLVGLTVVLIGWAFNGVGAALALVGPSLFSRLTSKLSLSPTFANPDESS